MEVNNIRDIRESLLKVSTIATLAGMVMSPESAIEAIREILKPISAIHIRNCDVGTAEEQKQRYAKWRNHDGLRAEFGLDELDWAQTPYEEGGEKCPEAINR